MSASPLQGGYWHRVSGLALVAVVVAAPITMTAVMDRGYEIPKLLVTAPLAFVAFGAALTTARWRDFVEIGAPTLAACGALAVFLSMAIGGALASDFPESAVHGSFFRMEGLIAWLAYGATFGSLLLWVRESDETLAFVDAMLIASVIPACYAVQQTMNLDFYLVPGRDASRANGTQGNPIHLAEYLCYLIPLTLARIWLAGTRLRRFLPWLLVLLVQVAGLWVTQTRGPFLAGLAGVMMLAVFAAGFLRRRAIFVAVATSVFAATAFLAAINVVDAARSWAQSVPFVSRMVFALGSDAGSSTSLASRSIVARLGIWEAGNATLLASPMQRKLFGYGPESAYRHYYPNIPGSVTRSEDFRVTAIFDKLHADSLDIGLNFGVLGWVAYLGFFCAIYFGVARGLFERIWRPGDKALYFLAISVCAGLAVALAIAFGYPQAILPAACLGISGGWILFFAFLSWRLATRPDDCEVAGGSPTKWILGAGLVSSLLAFWIDAQINIPLLTSRIISFAVAALLLALILKRRGSEVSQNNTASSNRPQQIVMWGAVFAMVSAFASFLPALATVKTAGLVPELGLRVLPIGVFCLIALFIFISECNWRSRGHWLGKLAILICVPLIYCALHLWLRVIVDVNFGPNAVRQVMNVVAVCPVFLGAVSLVGGLEFARLGGGEGARPVGLIGIVSMLACACLAWIAFHAAWTAGIADVSATSSRWAIVEDQTVSDRLLDAAVDVQPHEWQYRRMQIHRQLGYALRELHPTGMLQDRFPEFRRRLDLAETAAREAVRLEPGNPWPVISLANILQVRALKMVRLFDSGSGAMAEHEADAMFRKAQVLFPMQPILYRNWAQLKFDGGYPAEGYRLLDAMEAIIPGEPEPYVERLSMARRFGHEDEVEATLARAASRLDPDEMGVVRSVVNAQQ